MKFKPFCSLLKAAAAEWWKDNVFRLAAALAFYTIFSVAPTIVIAVGLAGVFFGPQRAQREVVGQIETLIGPQGGAAIRQISVPLPDYHTGVRAVAIGVITVIIGSTVVFAELQSALNQIWDVQVRPDRHFLTGLLRERARSFAVVLVVGFLLLLSLAISAFISGAAHYISESVPELPWVWYLLDVVVSFFVAALLFSFIYKYLPDVTIAWQDVAIGSLVTAFLFTLGKYAIGAYLGKLAAASSHGAAGSFALLLLWVYYSALICFFGAEFTQVYARRYGSHIRPRGYAMRKGNKPDRM